MINYEKVDLEMLYQYYPIRFEISPLVKEILMSDFDLNFGYDPKTFSDKDINQKELSQ